MAVTYTKILDQRVVANGATSGSGNYTSSAFTTSAGTVLVAVIGYGIEGNASTMDYDIPRPVTSGLTWIPRCRRYFAENFSSGVEIWVADNATGGSKTIAQTAATGQWNATSIKNVDVVVLELTGAAAAALQGNPFAIGGRIYGGGVDPGAQSLTLPVAPEATSLVVAVMMDYVYQASAVVYTVTPGADMTEIAEHAAGVTDTNHYLFQAQVRTGSTSQTVAWVDLQAGGTNPETYVWALAAAEFKQAGSTPNSQAVRFDGSTSWYKRAAFGFPASTDFTLTFWLKLASDRNNYSTAVGLGDAGSNYAHFGMGSSGTTLARDTTSGGSGTGFDLATLLGTRWVYFANVLTVAGTNGFMLWAESELMTVNGYPQSTLWNFVTTTIDFFIGRDSYSGDNFDGSIAAVKIWSAALTQAELFAEQWSSNPVRTANLFAYYPFNAGPSTVDLGPSGRTLTATGTPTLDTYGPPINFVNPYVPGPPSGLAIDNFNRSDTTSTLSGGNGLNSAVYSDWIAPNFAISGNKAVRTGSTGTDYALFVTTVGQSDMFAEVDYDVNGGGYAVVNVRRPQDNTETGYLGVVDPSGNVTIGKSIAGTYTALTSTVAGNGTKTGRIRMEAFGDLLTLKIDGTTKQTVNDSTVPSSYYAGLNSSGGATFDNFAIGGVNAVSPPVNIVPPLVLVPYPPMGG